MAEKRPTSAKIGDAPPTAVTATTDASPSHSTESNSEAVSLEVEEKVHLVHDVRFEKIFRLNPPPLFEAASSVHMPSF